MTTVNRQPIKQILMRGLWEENPGAVQLLGLCPLLAVTTTLQNGAILGVASLLTVSLSCLLVSLLRRHVARAIRLPICIVIIAAIVSHLDLWMEAMFYKQHQVLGLFVPLIITNCAILARAEAFALSNPPIYSLLDGFATGLGFTIVLCFIGAFREVLATAWSVQADTPAFLLALTPAGAFFSLAILIALVQIRKLYLTTPDDSRESKRSI